MVKKLISVEEFNSIYPVLFGARFPIRCLHPRYRNGHCVPCGHCALCMSKQARDWAFRVQAEAENSGFVYNVLLTYSDKHLEFDSQGRPVLVKAHLSQFMKRFRDRLVHKFGARLRFFACGEYGGKYGRPHYHMILFSDVDLCKEDTRGHNNLLFTYEELFQSWKKGFVKISRYNGEVGKMTRYMTQYMLVSDGKSTKRKPFRHMSRRPAIGACWLDKNKRTVDKMLKSEKFCVTPKGYERPIALPTYYKQKLMSAEMKSRHLEQYDKLCGDFYDFIFINYERRDYYQQQRRAQQLGAEYQREQYRKRKVHHTHQHPSGLFTQSKKSRQGPLYQEP